MTVRDPGADDGPAVGLNCASHGRGEEPKTPRAFNLVNPPAARPLLTMWTTPHAPRSGHSTAAHRPGACGGAARPRTTPRSTRSADLLAHPRGASPGPDGWARWRRHAARP